MFYLDPWRPCSLASGGSCLHLPCAPYVTVSRSWTTLCGLRQSQVRAHANTWQWCRQMTTNLFRTSNGVIAGPTNIHGACSGRADAAGDLTAAYGLISLETSEAGRSVSRPLAALKRHRMSCTQNTALRSHSCRRPKLLLRRDCS